MGKKRARKKLVSKGLRTKVSNGVRTTTDYLTKLQNISKAWKEFKNPWMTIENPDKSATNRRHIKVRTNELWGDPKFSK